MTDFGSLLSQFTKDAKTLSSSVTNGSKSRPLEEDVEEEQTTRTRSSRQKRTRQLDVKDHPAAERIVIVCPADVQTGGPEALHQLCDKLNATQTLLSATMVYCRSNGRSVSVASHAKRLSVYDRYDAPTEQQDDDDPFQKNSNPTTWFIWPECWTDEMMFYLEESNYEPSPCAIWWLSVDNNTRRFKDWDRTDILHLYQSEYAKQYLLDHGARHVYPMTECISDPPTPTGTETRIIDVLYNPVKGIHYTDEIRKRSGAAFQMRPIGDGPDGRVRITPEQVRTMLLQAKVYIDFGHHPGMDRLPREAALAGCLVVTNRQGAAGFDQDVPLPDKYKRKTFDVEEIHQLLKELMENFDERSRDLDDYRSWIHGQEASMMECVSNFIDIIVTSKHPNK
jgi:hypothetical protein